MELGQLQDAKKQIIEVGKKLLASGLVVGTWGNISCRIDDKIIITPSGVDYTMLNMEGLPVVSLSNGMAVANNITPSTELPMHLAIYAQRADVKAIVHTHSIYATCCAVLGQPIPPLVEDMAMVIGGEIKVAQYHLPGTKELAGAVVAALGTGNGVLMANHGFVGVGHNLEESLKACILAEKAAQIFLMAKSIGTPVVLSDEDVKIMRNSYLSHYGQRR